MSHTPRPPLACVVNTERTRRAPCQRRTAPPRTEYTGATSRSSKASRRCASGPACTSAPPPSAACTTWCRRSSTTPSTRRSAGYADRIEVTLLADGGVRVTDNGRGMPVDMHPTQKKPDGRGHPHRAARRREVRQRHLRGVRRPARRRRLGRQRAEQPARGRDRPRRIPLDPALRRPEARRAAAKGEPTQQARHDGHLLGRRGDLRDHEVQLRDDQPPVAGDGVPQQGADDRPARRARRRRSSTRTTPTPVAEAPRRRRARTRSPTTTRAASPTSSAT